MNDRMVIDASVAAKWFLKDRSETDIDLADQVLWALLSDELTLYDPRIFTYEVCGLLTKACQTYRPKTREPRIERQRAAESIHELFSLPIQITDATEDEGVEALGMAVDYSKKHYDMTYVRLAQTLDCQWCTSDEKILEAMPPAFPRERVILLASLR